MTPIARRPFRALKRQGRLLTCGATAGYDPKTAYNYMVQGGKVQVIDPATNKKVSVTLTPAGDTQLLNAAFNSRSHGGLGISQGDLKTLRGRGLYPYGRIKIAPGAH